MKQKDFLKGVSDWNNHLCLMWLALEQSKEGEVMELGCGDGSTRQLHKYCKDTHRGLYSFDTSREWLKKFYRLKSPLHQIIYIENDWHRIKDFCPQPSVILVDNAPGESRIDNIRLFSDLSGIMVIHDTQPPPTAAAYGYDKIWHLFKYRIDLTCPVNPEPAPDGTQHNRTWASVVSNTFDVTTWRGIEFETQEKYTIL